MKPLLVLALVATALAGLWSYGCENRHVGRLAEQLAVLRNEYDSLEAKGAALDTVYLVRRDTLRLTRHRTDSILTTRTDTLIQVDTVRQIVAAERLACDQLVQTCEEQKALLLAENANLEKRLALQRPPSWLKRTATKVLWGGIGYGAGRLVR